MTPDLFGLLALGLFTAGLVGVFGWAWAAVVVGGLGLSLYIARTWASRPKPNPLEID